MPWRKVAEELNVARREGRLKRCLCVLPFAKKSVEMLADYALNHVRLQTLLGEEEGEEDEGKESEGKDVKKKEEGNGRKLESKGCEAECGHASLSTIRERVLAVVRELGAVEPRFIVEKLGISLSRVSEAGRKLVSDGMIEIVRNIPDLRSPKRPNTTLYLDLAKETGLHDGVINMIWQRNLELGGKCRDYSFEYNGKTWHTDGLLENTGGEILLEVVSGAYNNRVLEQVKAYTGQLDSDRSLKGVVIVGIENRCLEKLKEEALSAGIPVGVRVFIASLRPRDERLQFESLLRHGVLTAYHKNQT